MPREEKNYLPRLNKASQFQLIKKKGKSIHLNSMILKYLKNDEKLHFAVKASKKMDKLSVNRNYAKRRLKSLLYNSNIPNKGYLLMIAKKETISLPYQKLKKDFDFGLSKIDKS